MSIIQKKLIDKSKYDIKCPNEMKPIGVAIHNTYNDGSAKNEISYMTSNNNKVSFHIAVDDKEAIQAIPFNRNAWHSGDGKGEGNMKHIAIEICYSKTGGERFKKAEQLASKVVAEILNDYGWGLDRVKAHRDFSNKDCPHRTNMTEFKKLVSSHMQKSREVYRVCVGSYSVKSNADNMLKQLEKEGYKPFIIKATV